jgi:hypothetical protein
LFAKLCKGLLDPGFLQLNIDATVFFGQGSIVLTYIDDCIIAGDSSAHIEPLITLLHESTENFILQDEGSICKSLGVSITQLDNLSFSLTQPFLIDRIAAFWGINNGRTNERVTPVSKSHLNKDLNGVSQK